jgi:hypothetical protein
MQLVNVLIKHCFAHFLDATVIILQSPFREQENGGS